MKSLFGIVLFLALSGSLLAQQEKITGTVVDHQTGEPLAGVTVKHISSGLEVITDFDGFFSFAATDAGIIKFSLKYVSYQEVELNRVKVEEDQKTELMIKMRKVGADASGETFMAARPDNDPRS
ncbi:MAG: carboxypeptidase-like regulatory domain-containing protein [Cyclobacteriaceae bacterium]|nr:carboxypeptidase-like regulatory domain-containing protein [Cyclobacteriaceae bacterium]